MTQRPVLAGFVRATVAQEKSEKLLASPHQLHHGVDPDAHQITHRLVNPGTHTAVRSPERCCNASFCKSPRSVLIQSPGFRAINVGAATMQPCPRSVSWR